MGKVLTEHVEVRNKDFMVSNFYNDSYLHLFKSFSGRRSNSSISISADELDGVIELLQKARKVMVK